MTASTAVSRPSATPDTTDTAGPPDRTDARPDEPVRQAFEGALRRAAHDGGENGEEATGLPPPVADWGLLPRMPAMPDEVRSTLPAAGESVVASGAVVPNVTAEPSTGATAPAVASAPVPPPVSPVFDHLALPHDAAAHPGRFEVLQGAPVTRIAVDVGPMGGATVTVVAPAAQAAVLEHHLPQLQRRLAERVQARVRAGARPTDEER